MGVPRLIREELEEIIGRSPASEVARCLSLPGHCILEYDSMFKEVSKVSCLWSYHRT